MRILRRARAIGTWYVAEQKMSHLESIRKHELDIVISLLPKRGRVLEVGAGTGAQTQVLHRHGYSVCAIDIPSSQYRSNRVWPVVEYDGHHIPYDDDTFDVVLSSNVLEHVPHVVEFQKELHRVLKIDGIAVHVVPSSTWRLWTNIAHVMKCWRVPEVHGAHAKDAFTELAYFGRRWWTDLFLQTGWIVVGRYSNRLFYTGHCIMGERLTIGSRCRLSRILGGSCHIFALRERSHPRPHTR